MSTHVRNTINQILRDRLLVAILSPEPVAMPAGSTLQELLDKADKAQQDSTQAVTYYNQFNSEAQAPDGIRAPSDMVFIRIGNEENGPAAVKQWGKEPVALIDDALKHTYKLRPNMDYKLVQVVKMKNGQEQDMSQWEQQTCVMLTKEAYQAVGVGVLGNMMDHDVTAQYLSTSADIVRKQMHDPDSHLYRFTKKLLDRLKLPKHEIEDGLLARAADKGFYEMAAFLRDYVGIEPCKRDGAGKYINPNGGASRHV